MDSIELATKTITALSPLLIKGTEEVVKSAFKDVYNQIKERLCKKPENRKALENFEKDPIKSDSEFKVALTELLLNDDDLVKSLTLVLQRIGTIDSSMSIGNIEANQVIISNKIKTIKM